MKTNVGEKMAVSPTLQRSILVSTALFCTLVFISIACKIEMVARGTGRIVPSEKVHVIQSEVSGQVTAIYVENGQQVVRSEALIALDQTDDKAILAKIHSSQDDTRIEIARISALLNALSYSQDDSDIKDLALDSFQIPEGLSIHPIVRENVQLLEAEALEIMATFVSFQKSIAAHETAKEVLEAKLDGLKPVLEISRERFDNAVTLHQLGTISRSAMLDAQRELDELKAQRLIYRKQVEQQNAEIAFAHSSRSKTAAQITSDLTRKRADLDARLEILHQEEISALHRIDVSTITAPISGVIDQLKTSTIGGVVTEAEVVLHIVPVSEHIEIAAMFSNKDIGFMSVGQQVNISLDAYPSGRFGFLTGRVSKISADSIELTPGEWGYSVLIEVPAHTISADSKDRNLKPGMTATVDVVTGRRRIISYFFAPVTQTFHGALGER